MSEKNEPLLVVDGVSKEFRMGLTRKAVRALDNVSFTVGEGEAMGLLGPNGSGKSTLLKIFLGLIRPTQGKVSIQGHTPGTIAARRLIGYLPENPYFPAYLTPRELLHYYGRLSGLPRRAIPSRTDELLELVQLRHAENRPLRTFSKGMVQRAGLAQALLHDPPILLLDEPATGLDPIGFQQIWDLVLELKKQGKTILFTSHLMESTQVLADRVVIVHRGQMIEQGELSDLLAVPNEWRCIVRPSGETSEDELKNRLANLGDVSISQSRQSLHEFFIDKVGKQQESHAKAEGSK